MSLKLGKVAGRLSLVVSLAAALAAGQAAAPSSVWSQESLRDDSSRRFIDPETFRVREQGAEAAAPLSQVPRQVTRVELLDAGRQLQIVVDPVAAGAKIYDIEGAHRRLRQEQDPQQDPVRPERLMAELRRPLPAAPLARTYDYPPQNGAPYLPENRAAELYPQYELAAHLALFPRQLNFVYWAPRCYAWVSPNFFSHPLYFEQENLERYGHHVPGLQPAISAAHFFSTIPILPYKMGVHGPHERVYALGYFRPGSCNPAFHSQLPLTARGLVYQGAATTGLVFILP